MILFIVFVEDCLNVFFFFSSCRRHTSSKRDWSSDVCSSDLFRTTTWFMPRASAMAVAETYLEASSERVLKKLRYVGSRCKVCFDTHRLGMFFSLPSSLRSEERRVGKESSTR